MFLRNDLGIENAGGTSALAFGRAQALQPARHPMSRVRGGATTIDWAGIDWTPDLGARIGSLEWFRGAATCVALLAGVWCLSPGFQQPLPGATPPPLAGAEWEEARAQGIAPLAWGATTGRHMAGNDLVAPLADTPERPQVELTATLGDGDSFAAVLTRAGVSDADASRAAALVSNTASLDDLSPGTQLDLTLGRRANKHMARPLESLAFRARFDLALTVVRTGDGLVLERHPIAVDHTPLRIRGLVGSSLYRAARAAGAPAKTVETFIKALASRLSVGRDIGADDSFDLIVEHQRAATGEVQLGKLLFAGLERAHAKDVQLVRWGDDDKWYDADGTGDTTRGFMGMPVNGRISSTFGMRMHPILGLMRMHKGIDLAAPYGSPIYAPLDGRVAYTGRKGGYGNFVQLNHADGIASGYGHMSRIAVRPGERVHRGEVIGYVGSTGLSTGSHLHWEVWKNGHVVNPRSISLAHVDQLSGSALRAFKAKVASLLSVRPAVR